MARALLSATFLVLVLLTGFSSMADDTADYAPDELVCRVSSTYSIDSINSTYGTTLKSYTFQTRAYLLETPAGLDVDSLAQEISLDYYDEIIYCEPNYYTDAPEGVQSSQPFLDFASTGSYLEQQSSTDLRLSETWSFATGEGVQVAVIDGGVDFSHEAFGGQASSAFDYVDNDPEAYDEPGGAGSGHGTFVAGIIHLVAPDAQLNVFRVLDATGRGDGFSVSQAIVDAVDAGNQIINLSLVVGTEHPSLKDAIEYARDHNVIVIAAAGNDSLNIVRYPAADPHSLAIAALDSANMKADFSNFDLDIGVSAPGTRIYSPYPDGRFAWWEGTSFAAPFVTGEAALLLSANPWADRNNLLQAIEENTWEVDSLNAEFEGMLGSGRIDPMAALQSLALTSCGDIDQSGEAPDITDIVRLMDYLFVSHEPLTNRLAAEMDGSTTVDVGDLTALIGYVFLDQPRPVCITEH